MLRNMLKGSSAFVLTCFIVFGFTTSMIYFTRKEIVLLAEKVAYVNHTIAHLDGLVRWNSQVNREYVASFFKGIVQKEIRQWYTYPKSEVDLLNKLPDDSPQLIEHIRRNLLIPPPVEKVERISEDASEGQAKKIMRHFGNKSHGVFVECGASDGLFLSNTLWLESALNWTGVLIEPDPNSFKKLLDAKRNVWLMPTCLSVEKHPSWKTIQSNDVVPNVTESSSDSNAVHCMPLFSILLAVNQTIDYFSLDIGGSELSVLRTVPFHRIDVKVWSINHSKKMAVRQEMVEFMRNKGYRLLTFTEKEHDEDWAQNDVIFSRNDDFLLGSNKKFTPLD